MSSHGRVFGCIYAGGLYGSPKAMDFFQHNANTINSLPQQVDLRTSILIARNTFTVPMPDWGGFYAVQPIHFGQSFNHLEYEVKEWFKQFDALLRQLYWLEAYVYMQAEIGFSLSQFHWKADIHLLEQDPPQTISSWTFSAPFDPHSFEW